MTAKIKMEIPKTTPLQMDKYEYKIKDKTGTIYGTIDSIEQALTIISKLEDNDRKNGTYEKGFYGTRKIHQTKTK